VVYGFIFIDNFNNNITDLKSIGDMNYNVDRLLRRSRVVGFYIMEKNAKEAEGIRIGILETIVRLETKYIPVLIKYTSEESSKTPIAIYYESQTGPLRGYYQHVNGYELMKNIILWSKNLYDVSTEELINKYGNGTNTIFNDYRYR